ncbi:MAG: hypothetical protein ACLSVD_16175 [Eggerthellaceae bacterium]
MAVYDAARVHQAVVDRLVLDAVYDRLRKAPLAERRGIVGSIRRAPVIVAGMVILQTVLDLAGFDSFTVSETDIPRHRPERGQAASSERPQGLR